MGSGIVLVWFATIRAFEIDPAGRLTTRFNHGLAFFLVCFLKGNTRWSFGNTEDRRVDGSDLSTVRAGNFYGLLRHGDLHNYCTVR